MSKKIKLKLAPYCTIISTQWIRELIGLDKCEIIYGFNNDYDILLISGNGDSDVDPLVYGDTYINNPDNKKRYDDNRDRLILKAISHASQNSKKIIGVDYGGHLLCVANGGLILQEVSGHDTSMHQVYFSDDDDIYGSPSNHKAMMYPFLMHRSKYSLISWSLNESLIMITGYKPSQGVYNGDYSLELPIESDFFGAEIEGRYTNMAIEPEIIHFRNVDGLAIQSNPHGDFKDFNEKLSKIVMDYIKNNL